MPRVAPLLRRLPVLTAALLGARSAVGAGHNGVVDEASPPPTAANELPLPAIIDDDECAADGDCAVNALQRRASRRDKHLDAEAFSRTQSSEHQPWICQQQPWLCQGQPPPPPVPTWNHPWWMPSWNPAPQPSYQPSYAPQPVYQSPPPAPTPAPTPAPLTWHSIHNSLCDVLPWLCSSPTPAPSGPSAPSPILPPSKWPEAMRSPSRGQLFTFYLYRVQDDSNYPQPNHDMTNLEGALWYLHNEVVWHEGGRAGTYFSSPVSRILKFKIQTKATQPLLDLGMNFGVMNAFDSGACTGPFECDNFQKVGYVVGCETWEPGPTNFPHAQWNDLNHYKGATWYSLPGECPSKTYKEKTAECIIDEPGGMCPAGKEPTGTYDCTWTYEQVGEITIDELEGIDDYDAFVKAGGREYDPKTDKGVHMDFWDNLRDEQACAARVARAKLLFQQKYPDHKDLQAPPCDFDKYKFYPGRSV